MKYLNSPFICFLISIFTPIAVASDTDPLCEGQSLRAQGEVPKIIRAGSSFTVGFFSAEGVKEAELEVFISSAKGVMTVHGKMTSVGRCVVNTFQPLKLHPVRNGLPLGWHSLPDGINANPTLKSGEWKTFYRQYPPDYIAGFNTVLGTWRLETAGQEQPARDVEHAPASLAEELFTSALNSDGDGLAESEARLNETFARAQEADRTRQAMMGVLQQSVQTLNAIQAAEAARNQGSGLIDANPGYGYDYGDSSVKPISSSPSIHERARDMRPSGSGGVSKPGVR